MLGTLLGTRASVADHYRVPTGSMIPTVLAGDRIAVNKAAYELRLPFTDRALLELTAPARGDVVVVRSPEEGGKTLLKRVVAGPGDLVQVSRGRLWINGVAVVLQPVDGGELEQLGPPHRIRRTRGGGPDFGPARVPPDSYLLLGDNRGESHDGRRFGWVSSRAIQGRAIAVFARDGRPVWHPL
jgi:signal peptidase I